MSKFLGALVAIILFFFVASTGMLSNVLTPPVPQIVVQSVAPTPIAPTQVRTISATAVIQSIRSHAKLQTTIYQGAAQVEEERQASLFGLVGGEKVALTAVGQVVAGVDLEQVGPASVQVQGGTVAIQIPAPEMFSVTLDENSTYVSGHSLTWFSKADPALAETARREAVRQIRTKACEANLETRTESDAVMAITNLVSEFGFSSVQVHVAKGTMCNE